VRLARGGRLTRKLGALTLITLAAGPLAGCTSTQHQAQRMQLDAARQRAAQLATRVLAGNRTVTATNIGTISGSGKTAFIVTIANSGKRAVTDLPISVGYSLPGGPRIYLNDGTDLQYFEAHLPAVFPGHSRVWVYTADRPLPDRAKPFAVVGNKPSAPALLTQTNVTVKLSWRSDGYGRLRIALDNPTSVPQYQLQVYAYAEQDGRYLAAGNTTVTDLGAGSRQSLELTLLGDPGRARLRVEAIPTILQ